MPDANETGQKGGEDKKEQAKAEVRKKIEEAEKDPKNPKEAKEKLGKDLADGLRDVIEEAKEVVDNEKKVKRGKEMFVKKDEKNNVTIKVIKVIEAVKQGLGVENIAKTQQAQAFLQEVVRQIPSPSPSQCNQLAAYLTPYLLGDRNIIINPPDQSKSEFQTDFEALAQVNPDLARQVKEALLKAVEKGSISWLTEEMINNSLIIETSTTKNRERIPPELLETYSQADPKILSLLMAIQSKDSFLRYIDEIRQSIKSGEIQVEGEDENKKLSKYLEEQFVDLVDQLYYKFDLNPSYITEEFGHVESKGFTKSVEMAAKMLSDLVEGLIKELSDNSNFNDELKFFIRYTVTEEEVKDGRITSYLTVKPHEKQVGLADFLRFALNEMGHAREIREFTHNSRLLFRQGGAGKEGFWAQMASYASRMKATDFDSIAYLPHNDVFQEAMMIYNQFLQAELAKYDWILNPKIFARKESGFTEIEERTLDVLQSKYKNKKNDLQIRAALSRAIGVSLGILLTEVETIADADPGLKIEHGKVVPTFVGEWLSDTVATATLNPFTKGILRWMSEGVTGGPMAYLEIPDPKKIKGIPIGIWDHNLAFDQIMNFHQSFIEGERAKKRPGYKTLLDIRNPGRVGSIITRGGWREYYSYDYWLDYKVGEIEYYRIWRRIENIGFEPLVDFVTNRSGNFVSGKVSESERMKLIKYLLESYFTDCCKPDELERIKSESDFFEWWRKKYGGKKPDEIRRDFLFQSLSRVLLYRLPSKLITHDRTRWSEEGERMWERLRKRVFGNEDNSFFAMNQALQDLILAQSTLRAKLSDELGEIQEKGGDIGATERPYLLNEGEIERLLKSTGIEDQQRIENVKRLFGGLRDIYLGEGEGKGKIVGLSQKLKNYRDNFPFALAAEEIDYRFLVLRGAGETTIKRALNDMAQVEKNVANAYQELIGLWHKVAISGKKDISEIVALLHKIKATLNGMHGKEYANEITYYLAYLTIQYFKKDTFAKPLKGLAGIGRRNSIAAEFAGGSLRVREWDSRDIGYFIHQLEVNGVLEKDPYDLSKTPSYEPLHFSFLGKEIRLPEEINLSNWLGEKLGRKDDKGETMPIKLFGKEIKIKLPKMRKKDFSIYSKTLKNLAGGAFIHKLYDAINTVIPIGLAILLAILIYKAFVEAFPVFQNRK